MTRDAILWPMVALVALTAAVWCLMYWRRLREIRALGVRPQQLATRESAAGVLTRVGAADNFQNLLEAPVLFYVLCLALVAAGAVTGPQVALAWIYVALRLLHSAIHVTYNRVVHRFAAYVLSTVCLWAMWVLFAVSLAAA